MTRGKKSEVACGDHVQIARSGDGVGVIEAIEPRQRTLFYRSDSRRQKLIAANVTQIVVVVAPVPPFYEDLVNRCLVGAEHAGIAALIALNKMDHPEAARASATLNLYRELGYAVVSLAAKHDVSPLRAHLADKTSALVGQSGMGKSTIINALVPHAQLHAWPRFPPHWAADATPRLTPSSTASTRRATSSIHRAAGIRPASPLARRRGACVHRVSSLARTVSLPQLPPYERARLCALVAALAAGKIAESRLALSARLAEELVRAPVWD